MKKLKINSSTENLFKELEILTTKEQNRITGGYNGGYSTPAGYGGYNQYTDMDPLQFSNFVKVTSDTLNPGVYSTTGGYSFYSGNQGIDTYTTWGNYGGYGDPLNPIQLAPVTITAHPGVDDYKINAAMSAADWLRSFTGTSMEIGNNILKLAGSDAPAGFEVSAGELGWVGVVTNAYQFAETGDQKNLATALGEAALLILFASDPVVLIVGAAALYYYEKQP